MSKTRWLDGLRWVMLMGVVMTWTASGIAQEAANRAESPSPGPESNSVSDAVRELRQQVRELQTAVAGMRSDWQRSQAESAELRRELDEIRTGEIRAATGPRNAVVRDAVEKSEVPISERAAGLRDSMQNVLPSGAQQGEKQGQEEDQQNAKHGASLEEEYQLLSGKVDDQYQTKVESASKYRLRLSGIVLMNLVSNQGEVDSIDLPTVAYPRSAGDPGGSFGATLRQSEIGFEAFGPTVAGARTRADLQIDFAGGFPSVPNGVNSGLVRLRTGTMRMDWTNTSVVAGQDALFFSPASPTSFASLAVPALSAAGNLWGWVPQIRVEHRVALGEESSLTLQGGILDPMSGEVPVAAAGPYRQAGPGQSSRQPAFGTRIAWTRNVFGQPLRVGVGGFYSRQDYGFSRTVDAWAGMTDLELPLSHQFSLSGKLYRGKGLGGLYGAFGQSALFNGNQPPDSAQVRGLNSVGGWAQLKYRPANKWEFNSAFGMDNPYASDLDYFPYVQLYGGGNTTLARNRGSFVNMIYRPRSDLLFSAEYRHLTTYSITGGGASAGHLNLMMGVLF